MFIYIYTVNMYLVAATRRYTLTLVTVIIAAGHDGAGCLRCVCYNVHASHQHQHRLVFMIHGTVKKKEARGLNLNYLCRFF